jgi:hypothetical protein
MTKAHERLVITIWDLKVFVPTALAYYSWDRLHDHFIYCLEKVK